MHLELHTPEGSAFDGAIVSATLPGTEGGFQVLENHAPLVSCLRPGTLVAYVDGQSSPLSFEIGTGVAEIRENKLRILVMQAKENTENA